MNYKPPYNIDETIRKQLTEVAQLIGQIEGYQLLKSDLRLRKINKIKSLHSSLAIEGNVLSIEQVTALLEGKVVLGPAKDILEVQNAIRVYENLDSYRAGNETDLLQAHADLMKGLIPDAGKYRNGGVGVVDGDKVIHVAPPAKQVPRLMHELFQYQNDSPEDDIIKSCVFHYEFEFIHPFSDGNGRMGRLWQTVILKERYPILQYLPLENIIHRRQQAYYDALLASQHAGDSTPFIRYALTAIKTALEEQLELTNIRRDFRSRLRIFNEEIGAVTFTRKAYLQFHKDISPATATRDLATGVKLGMFKKQGEMRNTTYRFVAL